MPQNIALILLCIAVSALAITQPPKQPSWHSVSTGRIAPEVCERDGQVSKLETQGSLLRVTCSDGLIKLYSK